MVEVNLRDQRAALNEIVVKRDAYPRLLELSFFVIFGLFILRVLVEFLTKQWDFYPTHNDFDVTDFGISILAGHFNPHWYNYGYLTFAFSAVMTLLSYAWHLLSNGWSSVHEYLVHLMLEPSDVLAFNRIGFFLALCLSVYLAGRYVWKRTNVFYGLLFLAGIIITSSFFSLRFLIKSQSIDLIWVVISLGLAEKLHESTGKKNLIMAGCVAGFAWSTSFTGLFLAITFFLTVVAYQTRDYVGKKLLISGAMKSVAYFCFTFVVAFFITSPYALINFSEWSHNTMDLVRQGEIGGFTWDRLPSLQKTLDYIGYSSMLSPVLLLLVFIGFVVGEARKMSLQYLHPILFVALCLYVYSRSPHVKDYYLFPFTVVMTVYFLIFFYRIERKFLLPGLRGGIPILLFSLVLYSNAHATILSGFFKEPDFSLSRGYERSKIMADRNWINSNINTNAFLILDGWLHFIPPITCTDSTLNSNLWGHYRYGRQFNAAIQALAGEAWKISGERGDNVYSCFWTSFVARYEERKIEDVKRIIKKRISSRIVYVVSIPWCNQFLGVGMSLTDDQKPFVEYYRNLLAGRFGNIVFKDSELLIVDIDKAKYLSIPTEGDRRSFDFETGLQGWFPRQNINITPDHGNSHGGDASLRIEGTSHAGLWDFAESPQFDLVSGGRYRVSSWMFVEQFDSPVANPELLLKVGIYEDGKWIQNVQPHQYDLRKTGEWQLFSFEFDAPRDSNLTGNYTVDKRPMDADIEATMYIDDLSVELIANDLSTAKR